MRPRHARSEFTGWPASPDNRLTCAMGRGSLLRCRDSDVAELDINRPPAALTQPARPLSALAALRPPLSRQGPCRRRDRPQFRVRTERHWRRALPAAAHAIDRRTRCVQRKRVKQLSRNAPSRVSDMRKRHQHHVEARQLDALPTGGSPALHPSDDARIAVTRRCGGRRARARAVAPRAATRTSRNRNDRCVGS